LIKNFHIGARVSKNAKRLRLAGEETKMNLEELLPVEFQDGPYCQLENEPANHTRVWYEEFVFVNRQWGYLDCLVVIVQN